MIFKDVANLVALALANFPNLQEKNMRPTAVLWQKMLGDTSYDLAEQAVIKVLMTARFFPTVAEIREAIDQLSCKDSLPSPEEAWEEVIKTLNPYKPAEYSHKIIDRAVGIIGYRRLCESENISVERAQFWQVYKALTRRRDEERVKGKVLQLCSNNKPLNGGGEV